MTTEAAGGIIIAHNSIETVELAPLPIDYNQSVEEMVALEKFSYINPNLTTANFGESKTGKTGIVETGLVLARPVPSGKAWNTDKVLSTLDEAGFIPEDLPALSSLKSHMDELYQENVPYVTALGERSRWRGPCGVQVGYLRLLPGGRGFRLYGLERGWDGFDWFVVRRK